jgi:hypothetical protein
MYLDEAIEEWQRKLDESFLLAIKSKVFTVCRQPNSNWQNRR